MDHPPLPEWVNLDLHIWCSQCRVDSNCTFRCLASHIAQFGCHNEECLLHTESVHADPSDGVLHPWLNAPHQDFSFSPVPVPFGTRVPATGGQDEKPRRADVKPESDRARGQTKTSKRADAGVKPDKSRRTGVNPDADHARGQEKTRKYADVKPKSDRGKDRDKHTHKHKQHANSKAEPDRGRAPVRDQDKKQRRAEARPLPGYARAQDRTTRQRADVEPQPDYVRGQDKKTRKCADPKPDLDRDRKKRQDPKPSRHDDAPRPRGRSQDRERSRHRDGRDGRGRSRPAFRPKYDPYYDPVYDDIIMADPSHRRGRSTPPPRTKHDRVDDDHPRGRHDGKREKSRAPKTKHRDPSPRADQNPFADPHPRGARDHTMPQPEGDDLESPFNDDFFRRARDRMKPQFPPADLGGNPFADPFFQRSRTRARTGGHRARPDPLGVDSYLAGTFADLKVMAEGIAQRFGKRHTSRSRRGWANAGDGTGYGYADVGMGGLDDGLDGGGGY